jgi:hypothetical protein
MDSHSIPTRRGSLISATTDQMGLDHPETDGTSFTFLGFSYVWGRSRTGKNVVRQVTAKNCYARALAAVTAWCRMNRHQSIPDQHAHLTAMMRGHYAYYGITGKQIKAKHKELPDDVEERQYVLALNGAYFTEPMKRRDAAVKDKKQYDEWTTRVNKKQFKIPRSS